MTDHPNVDRSIRAWLIAEAPERASQRLLDRSRERIQSTRQRRAWWPAWRIPYMNTYAKMAIAGAALIALAFVGFNVLTNDGGVPVGGPAPSPAASSSPPAPSPSTASGAWLPLGSLAAERYDVFDQGVPFSFAPSSADWHSLGASSPVKAIAIGNGTGSGAERPDFAWIVFTGIRDVSTDPCVGESVAVDGTSVDDLVAALGAIPGTSAEEPQDVTIGGLPGKLVTLTVDPDPPCPMNQFWLYGDTSLYPNSAKSIIRIWITEVDGQRWSVHTDQADVNTRNDREIRQIIDSIQFE